MTIFGQAASPPLSDHWGVRASFRTDHEAAASADASAFEQLEEESQQSSGLSGIDSGRIGVHGAGNLRQVHAAPTSHAADASRSSDALAGRGHQSRGSEVSEAPELTVKTALAWIPPPQDWAPVQVSQ